MKYPDTHTLYAIDIDGNRMAVLRGYTGETPDSIFAACSDCAKVTVYNRRGHLVETIFRSNCRANVRIMESGTSAATDGDSGYAL